MSVMKKNVECFQGNSKVTGLFNKRAYKTHLNMEDIYIIISKYLLGTASPQEEKEIMEWRNADAGHEQEFQELCESWQIAHAGIHPVIPDKERVWEKIMSNLNLVKPVKMYTRRLLYRAVGIAAMLALALGFSFSLLVSEEEEAGLVSFTAPVGQKAEVSLPDGTKVWLNSGSTLSYFTDYGQNTRSVKLRGQAFFDVAKNRDKQFDVSIGDLEVRVHGTAFDINGYTDNSEVEVVLLRGHVTVVSTLTDKLLADMKPNQKAVIPLYEKDKCKVVSCNAEEESLWRLGKLKIENEDLGDVVKKMECWYGVKIQLNNIPGNKRYWMTIKTESLKEMLEIINRVTPIVYTINGEEVSITSKK